MRSRLGHQKDLSRPFPCQDGDCGCMSAEQCWKNCCCRTREQNIAWAKAHHVEIPDYVLAAASKETTSKVTKTEKSCCSKPSGMSTCCSSKSASQDCCTAKTSCSADAGSTAAHCDHAKGKTASSCGAAESKSCCQTTAITKTAAAKSNIAKNETGKAGKRWKWVNGLSAAKCHGLAFDWMLAGVCDVPPVECYLIRDFQTGWVTSSPAIFFTVEESPAIPPPRALCPAFLA